MAPSGSISRWPAGVVCALLLATNGAFAAAIDIEKLAEVKAAWLKNIAELTTWPETGSAAENLKSQPIVIGGLGRDPNGVIRHLRSRIQSKDGLEVQNRQLQLLELNLPEGNPDPGTIVSLVEACDLLFLSEDTQAAWNRIKPYVGDMPIVTVSEFEGFASQGGVIEYFLNPKKGRVFMIVNMDAMKRTGVVLSARLLTLKSVTILREEERAP